MKTLRERLEEKIMPVTETGCWLWTGVTAGKGYGYIRLPCRGKMTRAHRVAYELYKGPIPSGLCVLHKCDTRSCCNPEHLFLGTLTDNNRDRIRKGRDHNKKKTHCRNGHEYNAYNTRNFSDGSRECKICRRATSRRWKTNRGLVCV